MNFCYLHPDTEAAGQCTNCQNWICSRDYNLLKEKLGERKEFVTSREADLNFSGSTYTTREVTRTVTGPIIYCTHCYEIKLGFESELNANKERDYITTTAKVLMCTQCGEKIRPEDQFCPSCGDSTRDEHFDSENPVKGIQASKTLK